MKEAVRFVTVHLHRFKLSSSIAYDASSFSRYDCWLFVILFALHSRVDLGILTP